MTDPSIYRQLADLEERLRRLETAERPAANHGDAWPAAWPENVPFYRSDLDLWAFFDGTRWLTAQEYLVHLNVGTGLSVNTTVYAAIDTAYDILITRHVFSYFVATTNNGTNYWRARLFTVTTSGTLRDTLQTDATAANTWDDGATDLAVIGTGVRVLSCAIDRIGAPGSLDGAILVAYRKIVP